MVSNNLGIFNFRFERSGARIVIYPDYANTSGTVRCRVPASAGTFTIPPHMLFTLPTGNGSNFYFELGDHGPATSSAFSGPGLDIGLAQSFIDGVSLSNCTIGN